MTEKTARQGKFDWLLKKFNINFTSLDSEQQELVTNLGEKGVDELVAKNKGTKVHRGERISQETATQRAENLARLFESSNEPKFVGPSSRKVKNKPKDWVNEEFKELLEE